MKRLYRLTICLVISVFLLAFAPWHNGATKAYGKDKVINDIKIFMEDIEKPEKGKLVTFPKQLYANIASPSGYQTAFEFQAVWQHRKNIESSETYTPEDIPQGTLMKYIDGEWMLSITIYPGEGYVFDEDYGKDEDHQDITLGGLPFHFAGGSDQYINYYYSTIVGPVTEIKGFTLKASKAFETPAVGSKIKYPHLVSVESTDPAGHEDVLRIKYGWYDQTNRKEYREEDNDTGTFTPGKWNLYVFVERIDYSYIIDYKEFDEGKYQSVKFGGKEFKASALSENCIVYDAEFTVKKNAIDISNAKIGKIKSPIYSKTEKKPKPTVKIKIGSDIKTLKPGTDFTFAYKNNINIGSANLYVQGKGDYEGLAKTNFKIIGSLSKKITKCSINKIPDKIYNGKAIKPKVVVKAMGKKGKVVTLKKGTDYTVTYKNNNKPGRAKITIKGKGFYTGKKIVSFRILPKKAKIVKK